MPSKKINMQKIAEMAGVSIATVSRALNGDSRVRQETRQRILQIVQRYNYKPNSLARGLSRQRTDTIGVILPELVDEFFMEIIRGIDTEAYAAGQYVMVSSSHSQRNIIETLMDFMAGGRVDGLILMAPTLGRELITTIEASPRPVVLLNARRDLEMGVRFNIDNYRGAFTVVEHLIREHGYEKIGMIQGPLGNCDAEERYRGFIDALEKYQLPVKNELIVQGDFTAKSGYLGFIRLMNQPGKPDAVFAANDMMAVGAYEAAKNLGIAIPDDVALVGFDGISLGRFLSPRLTTVHVPMVELGSKSVRYLLKMISGEVEARSPYHEELPTGLVIGGSCGCTPTALPGLF
jgi:LacI family transcriptional regulator